MVGIPLLIKLPLPHNKTILSKNDLHLKLSLPKWNRFQSSPFVSIHASLSFAVFLLCCSVVLSGYYNVSFYFLSILGVTKLHHFA